ncbi:hypothetical protein VTO73DRAFT_2389 [Trametes versicolor]
MYEQTTPSAEAEAPPDMNIAEHANTAELGSEWDEVAKQAAAAGLDTTGYVAQAAVQARSGDDTSPAASEHQMASPEAFYGTPSQRTGNESAARHMFSLEETAEHTAEHVKLEQSLDWLNSINMEGSYTPSPDERSNSNAPPTATYVTTQQDTHASNVIGRGVKRARTEALSPVDPQEATSIPEGSVAGAGNPAPGPAPSLADSDVAAEHTAPADEGPPAYGPDDFQSSDLYLRAKLAFEVEQASKNLGNAVADHRGRQLADSRHAPQQTPTQPPTSDGAHAQGAAPQHTAPPPLLSPNPLLHWQSGPALTGSFALRTPVQAADDHHPAIQYATSATRAPMDTHHAPNTSRESSRSDLQPRLAGYDAHPPNAAIPTQMDVDPQENAWRSLPSAEYAPQTHPYHENGAEGAAPAHAQPEQPLFTFTGRLPGAPAKTAPGHEGPAATPRRAHAPTPAHASTSAPANMYTPAPAPAYTNEHTYPPAPAPEPARTGMTAPEHPYTQPYPPVPASAPAPAHGAVRVLKHTQAQNLATGVTSFRRPTAANAPPSLPVIVATAGIPWMQRGEGARTQTQPAPGLHTAPAARDAFLAQKAPHNVPQTPATSAPTIINAYPPSVQHAQGAHELPMSLPSLPICASFRDGESRALWLTENRVLRIAPRPVEGFPERVTHGPLDMTRHHDASVLEDFSRQPYGTVCAFEIFHQPHLISKAMVRVYYFHLFDMLVDITGETTFELIGPPANGAISKWDRPTLWLAKKFSTNAVRILCTYWAWSGEHLSFLATVKLDDIPKYAFTIEELLYSDANPINIEELHCLVQATIRDSIVTFFSSPDYARLQAHANAIAGAAEVKLQNYGPHNGRQGKIVVIVSCPPPTMNPVEWTNWRDHLRTYEYSTATNGNPRLRRIARCDGCHGADHPTHLCPFKRVPRWHNPEDDDVAGGVSVGNATRAYNTTPAQFYQPPSNEPSGPTRAAPPGSTRVAVGTGGAYFSRPSKKNAQGGGKARPS